MQDPHSLATPTAHLIGPGKLKVINGRLAFSTGKGRPTRLDPRSLKTVVCYGRVGVTDDAFAMLFAYGIEVSWMTYRGGRLRGRLASLDDSAARVRMLQHQRLALADVKLHLARRVVVAKVQSQLQIGRHYQRHGQPEAYAVVRQARYFAKQADSASSLEQLRGIEGNASRTWFTFFGSLLKPPWEFTRRVRRPPTDPVNALLSLGYTFLLRNMISRVSAAGLELNMGALHEYRAGRPSLACDLIEPLRAPLVDRWVLKICRGTDLTPSDFRQDPGGGIKLQRDAFPRVLALWEQHWLDTHAARQVDQEVTEFARALTGEEPGVRSQEPGGRS